MRFAWDLAKDDRNWRERSFGFAFAALIFLGETLEWRDDRKAYGELRLRANGAVGTQVLHGVYTDRGDIRRIISARLANKKERERWAAR